MWENKIEKKVILCYNEFAQITQSKGDLLMEFILQQVADNCTDFLTFKITKIFNDEDHVSLQTGKNIKMKLATVYTDKVDVGSKHMELVEKHSFILFGRLSSRHHIFY